MHTPSIGNTSAFHKVASYLAAAALLVIYTGDVHGHVCLDGFDHPVAYHADNFISHDDLAGDEADHNDVDNKISLSTLQAKSPVYDHDQLGALLADFPPFHSEKHAFTHVWREFAGYDTSTTFLPPLRAPPVIA